MVIRLATVDDARAISALIRPLAEKYIAHALSSEGAQNLLASIEPDAIAGYLNSGYRYHVAEESGRLAGVVAVRDNKHLYHLFVAESFHGRGLARQLWETARHACLESGNPGEFTVNSSKFARGMYLKFGFTDAAPTEERNGVIYVPMKYPNPTSPH